MSPLAKKIAGAITQHESKGDCSQAGKSGENGCFQFIRSTWIDYSNEVVGRVLPMTPTNERYVALKMIDKWLSEGYTTSQVVLRWNHPIGLRTGCSSGINSQGVPWDSCAYQRQVMALL